MRQIRPSRWSHLRQLLPRPLAGSCHRSHLVGSLYKPRSTRRRMTRYARRRSCSATPAPCQARELLGHSLPSGDLATVLKNAALAYVQLLERQKFAKCRRPRPQRVTAKGRHIPAEVKRKVWERDGGQCTFVSEHGK